MQSRVINMEQLSAVDISKALLQRVSAAYVSTFPPRECGIATFTRDLTRAIQMYNPLARPQIVALNDEAEIYNYPGHVRWQIAGEDPESYREVARALNASPVDVVSIQHEFGIFGGKWGAYLLVFLKELRKPVVTTLHTVLPNPPRAAVDIIRALYARGAATVVMTPAAREILHRDYGIDGARLRIIPHGVPAVSMQDPTEAKARVGLSGRMVVSSFGLINSGKGIEDVLDALPTVAARFPQLLYLVLGETHPVVRREQGEEYRTRLVRQVHRLGLEPYVKFNNRFLSDDELVRYLMATDIYITPYHNPDQIVSGTLSYAMGCGRAIVSTPYLYAKDALGEDRGVLIPFRDPKAIADALTRLLGNPALRQQIQQRAFAYGKQMRWPRVAAAYLSLFREVRMHADERGAAVASY
jgi:glycosyltransferase involved in cell wall biosynthesis